MVCEIEKNISHEAVCVTCKGVATYSKVKDAFISGLKELDGNGFKRLVCDFSSAPWQLSTEEVFNLPRDINLDGVWLRPTLSVVYAPGDNRQWDFHFFEIVYRTIGAQVRAFNSLREALKWIAPEAYDCFPHSNHSVPRLRSSMDESVA